MTKEQKIIPPLYDHQQKIINDDKKFTGLWLGTGCLAKGTNIPFWDGSSKKIEDVKKGDILISFDEYSGVFIPNKVDVRIMTCHKPKPMIEFIYEQEKIKTTYDHPFYNGEGFYPIYQLLWGKMETSKRTQLKLLCKQYGATFNNKMVRGKHSCCNETCSQCKRIFKNCCRQEEYPNSQNSSKNMAEKSKTISNSKSHKWDKRRQPSRKFRMVYVAVQCMGRDSKTDDKNSNSPKKSTSYKKTTSQNKKLLLKKYASKKEGNKDVSLRYFTKAISTSKKSNLDRNSDWKVTVSKAEPYYSVVMSRAPYTYCIGTKNFYITHNSSKTRTALHMAEGKTLIIVPKQQKLDMHWEKENELFDTKVDYTIVSKDMFKKIKPEQYDTIIIDEVHYKLSGLYPDTRRRGGQDVPRMSQMFEYLLNYLRKYPPKRLYLLSATPTSKPMGILAIVWVLGKNWDFFKFREHFYTQVKMGFRTIWIPRKSKSLDDELIGYLKSFGYTGQLSDYFDVPEQTSKTIYVQLSTSQKLALKQIVNTEPDPMVLRGKMRAIENGILYTSEVTSTGGKYEQLSKRTTRYETEKFERIKEFCQEFKKILIFCRYTGQIEYLKEELEKEGYKVWTLTGSTQDRGNVIQEAENAQEGIVIAQSSISSGYRLKTVSCVIFCSLSPMVRDAIQGVGRLLSSDCLKKNLIVYLVTKGGADEDCYKSIQSGVDFQEKLTE